MVDSNPVPLALPLAGSGRPPRQLPRRTHWAHVTMVALHTLCCALPLAASVTGLAASAALMSGVLRFHSILHGRELWLLGASAALVALGAFAEWRFMRGGRQRMSRLFAVSVACFAFNAAIVAGHRAGASPTVAQASPEHAH